MSLENDGEAVFWVWKDGGFQLVSTKATRIIPLGSLVANETKQAKKRYAKLPIQTLQAPGLRREVT